jgi:ABC-type transport system substrate-binding protein
MKILLHLRRSTRSTIALASASLLALVLLTAAYGSTHGQTGSQGHLAKASTLRVVWTIGPTTFDPAKTGSCEICNKPYLYPIYDRLIYLTTNSQLKPMLATSWRFDRQGNLVMTLRKGVKFQDGMPFNAAAVKANITRSKTLPGATQIRAVLKIVKSVQVINDNSVRFVMNTPNADLPYLLAGIPGVMVSPSAFTGNLDQHPVGTGPYQLVSATFGDSGKAVYKKWAGYWDRSNRRVDQLVLAGIPDSQQRVNALVAGDADAVNVKSDALTRATGVVSGNPQKYALTHYQTLSWLSVFLNTAKAPVSMLPVRQALAYAIDRNTLTKTLGQGQCRNATQPFPPGVVGHDPALDQARPYDPSQARQLLASAGFPQGVTLKFLVLGTAPWTDFATAIQSQLQQAGITAQLDVQPPSDADQIWAQRSAEYDGYIAIKDAQSDPSTAFSLVEPPFNPGGMPASIEKLALQAVNPLLSAKAQTTIWLKVARQVVDQAPEVWICYPPFAYLHRTNVGGTESNSLGPYLAVDPSRWYLK